jgi:hypothetical protein
LNCEAKSRPAKNRAVFVFVENPTGRVLANLDRRPMLGRGPLLERIADSNQTWRYLRELLRYSIGSRGGRPWRKMPIEHHDQTRSAQLKFSFSKL